MNNYKYVCTLLLGWIMCIVLFSACKKDVYAPNKNEPAEDVFDFATTVDKKLDIDYGMKGNKAVFEVFTEDPIVIENGKAKVHFKSLHGQCLQIFRYCKSPDSLH